MQSRFLLLSLVATIVAVSAAAAADPAPKQKTAATAATLYRVDEGVFDLRQGEVIDLTDRKITLHVNKDQNPENIEKYQRFEGRLGSDNGYDEVSFFVGRRFNLKDNYKTREMFKDRSHCFVDPIGLVSPKGAPMVVTFRLSCE